MRDRVAQTYLRLWTPRAKRVLQQLAPLAQPRVELRAARLLGHELDRAERRRRRRARKEAGRLRRPERRRRRRARDEAGRRRRARGAAERSSQHLDGGTRRPRGSRRFARRFLVPPIALAIPGPSAMRSPASPHASPNSPNLMWQADQIVRRARSPRALARLLTPRCCAAARDLRTRRTAAAHAQIRGQEVAQRRGLRLVRRDPTGRTGGGRGVRAGCPPPPQPHTRALVSPLSARCAGLACSRALRAIHEGDAG